MANVKKLTFNPFQENTYIVYDDTGECVIFDPGCYTEEERETLQRTVRQLRLTPVRLVNTHCHLDHVFGNRFVAETYQLDLEIHEGEQRVLKAAPKAANFYGVPMDPADAMPNLGPFLREGETLTFGQTELEMRFAPGHSPASLCFYCAADGFVIAGDVLFRDSIGRTDLPGGDYDTLLNSIRTQLMTLPDEVVVHSGHGADTTVGYERRNNPFLNR